MKHYSHVLEEIARRCKIERCPIAGSLTTYKITQDRFVVLRFRGDARGGKYFFGVEEDVIKGIGNQPYSVLLVCGTPNDGCANGDTVILPAAVFRQIADGVPIHGGQWKVNVHVKDGVFEIQMTGKPRIPVMQYVNNFDLLFADSVALLPLPESQPESKQQKTSESDKPQDEVEALKKELVENASNSKDYTLLEKSVTKTLNFLGFTAHHIGGSKDTDTLVTAPIRAVVDSKATGKSASQSIDFVRIEQHRKKHGADYKVIVSRGFQPADEESAVIMDTTLMPVPVLCQVIDLCRECSITTSDLIYLFNIHRIVNAHDLDKLRERDSLFRRGVDGLGIVLDSIDESPKSLPELFGRYQTRCEIASVPSLDKSDFERTLNFLAVSFLNVIACDGAGNYWRILPLPECRRKVAQLGQTLFERAEASC